MPVWAAQNLSKTYSGAQPVVALNMSTYRWKEAT